VCAAAELVERHSLRVHNTLHTSTARGLRGEEARHKGTATNSKHQTEATPTLVTHLFQEQRPRWRPRTCRRH
jgi:hypothetical protein